MASTLKNPQRVQDLLLFRLSRLLAVAGAPIVRLCEGSLGITWREWRVIASLQPGISLLSSSLADVTHLDRARTSRAVTSLLAKGLVERKVVQGDRRKAFVSLTPKGCELYDAFFPVVAEINAQLMQSLSAADIAVVDRVLTAIQAEAQSIGAMEGLPKANRSKTRVN